MIDVYILIDVPHFKINILFNTFSRNKLFKQKYEIKFSAFYFAQSSYKQHFNMDFDDHCIYGTTCKKVVTIAKVDAHIL